MQQVARERLRASATVMSSTTIDDLPAVLLGEILCRLPLNLVHQCKSVCKNWCALISSSQFSRTFLSHPSRSHPPLLYLSSRKLTHEIFPLLLPNSMDLELKVSNFPLSFLDTKSETSDNQSLKYVLASCKDLLLCVKFSSHRPVVYCVCNPITKQSVELPQPPQHMIDGLCFGLIYNEDQNCPPRFKVVHVPIQDRSSELFLSQLKVVIFSSETGQWKEILVPQPNFDWGTNPCAIAHNGKLYWKPWHRNALIEYDPFYNEHVMISIDTKNVYSGHKYFGVSSGCLRMLGKSNGTMLKIWELKERCEELREWDLKYMASVKDFVMKNKNGSFLADLARYPWIEVLGFDPNDGDIVYLVNGDRYVVLCNFKEETLEVVYEEALPWASEFPMQLDVPLWPTPVPGFS